MRFPVRLLLLAPGPLRYVFVKEGLSFYTERLKPFLNFEALFPKVKSGGAPESRLREEARMLKKHLPEGGYLVVLDERGRRFRTKELASWFGKLLSQVRQITVVCGGPEGLPPEILEKADFQLSLSPLTLNHELALLVFCEALYRALTILSGHPYHRE